LYWHSSHSSSPVVLNSKSGSLSIGNIISPYCSITTTSVLDTIIMGIGI
jgi:hypothetical protein